MRLCLRCSTYLLVAFYTRVHFPHRLQLVPPLLHAAFVCRAGWWFLSAVVSTDAAILAGVSTKPPLRAQTPITVAGNTARSAYLLSSIRL